MAAAEAVAWTAAPALGAREAAWAAARDWGRDAAAGDGLAGMGGGSSADAGGTGGRSGCAAAVPSTGGLKPETVCSVYGWCWSRPLPTGNIVSGLWGSAATGTSGVTGAIGTVLHFAGDQWSGTTALVDADFGPVHGKNANDVWFAGGLGALAHWNGAAVAVVPTGTPSTFYGLWEASPQDVWLCAGNSTARWNGSTLATVSARQYSACNDIWGTTRRTYGSPARGASITGTGPRTLRPSPTRTRSPMRRSGGPRRRTCGRSDRAYRPAAWTTVRGPGRSRFRRASSSPSAAAARTTSGPSGTAARRSTMTAPAGRPARQASARSSPAFTARARAASGWPAQTARIQSSCAATAAPGRRRSGRPAKRR